MATTSWRATALLATTALMTGLLAWLLAGCGDGDPAGPAAPAESSRVSDTAPTSSGPSSSDPGGDSSVRPTQGAERTLGSMTLRFPRGWPVDKVTHQVLSAFGPEGFSKLSVTGVLARSHPDLDALARSGRNGGTWEGRPSREDIEVDGVTMYRWSGPTGAGTRTDVLGADSGGYLMTVLFQTELPRSEHDALLERVLASVVWS